MSAIWPRDGLARLTSAMTLTPSALSAAIASRGDGARRAISFSSSRPTCRCRSARSARTPSRISSSTLTPTDGSPAGTVPRVLPPLMGHGRVDHVADAADGPDGHAGPDLGPELGDVYVSRPVGRVVPAGRGQQLAPGEHLTPAVRHGREHRV